ncbi:MAG: mechanosensitive ion channel family protein [Acidobacteria bacterium]|nr:mechanosensitive ion channel family protein [Acidobacteriota bacterium]MBV9477852.1 mechanosensitive ion channel family protein [Acidobacteriota bacterium]
MGESLPVSTKIIASLIVLAVAWALSALARWIAERRGSAEHVRRKFWIHQLARVLITSLWLFALATLWITGTARMGTIAAVLTAGLTVALQRVITSIAGYFSILRGSTFTVGDRITMGGVRGDVVALSYLRTTIMEMGQPPAVKSDEPAMWIEGRQYTGRIVTITNDKDFDTPVYNYTREFPYIWEEIRIPIKFDADWRRVERTLLELAGKHTDPIVAEARAALPRLLARFTLFEPPRIEPATFVRITDNWIELTVRFIARDRGVRELKSAMSRDILGALAEANIDVASTTFAVVGVPPLQLEHAPR